MAKIEWQPAFIVPHPNCNERQIVTKKRVRVRLFKNPPTELIAAYRKFGCESAWFAEIHPQDHGGNYRLMACEHECLTD